MSFDWKAWIARIDDMNLRERVMLFGSVALVVVVAAHVTLIDRLLTKQKGLIERVARDQSQLKAVREQLQSALKESQTQVRHPDEAAIADLESKIREAEKKVEAKQRAFIAPEELPVLLRQMLGRNPQLKLESLRLLPGTPLQTPGAAASASAPGKPAGAQAGAEVYRHGVAVTLTGSYFDLLQYLSELEKLPAPLLWGKFELQVEKYPEVKLTLIVHTLSTRWSLLAT
jgi:MSHA biogenesis protein MshJ